MFANGYVLQTCCTLRLYFFSGGKKVENCLKRNITFNKTVLGSNRINELFVHNAVNWNGKRYSTAETTVNKAGEKRITDISLKQTQRKQKNILRIFQDDFKDSMNIFPEKCFVRKSKTPEIFYVAHENAAKEIAYYLLPAIKRDITIPLIEINPGPGILTKKILPSNIFQLHLIESADFFSKYLETLKLENTSDTNISLKIGDFIGIHKLAFQDKLDGGKRVEELLMNIQLQDTLNDINARLFACTSSLQFMKNLIFSIIYPNQMMSLARTEMYLVMPPPLYHHLTCSKDLGLLFYRDTTILFQIIFEYEFLTKILRKYFLPWQQKHDLDKNKKLTKVNSIDPEYFYLVKIVRRKNLYDLCSVENLPALLFFIKQHMISRRNKIIPTLEKWIPGCGSKLITNTVPIRAVEPINKEHLSSAPTSSKVATTMSTMDFFPNINIFTQFGDLTPSQMLTIFNQFKNFPEYKYSSFLTLVETNYKNLTTDNLE